LVEKSLTARPPEDDELRGAAANLNNTPRPLQPSDALRDRVMGIHRKEAAARRLLFCCAAWKRSPGTQADIPKEAVDQLPIVNPLLGIAGKVDIPTGVKEHCLGVDGSEVKTDGIHAGLLMGYRRSRDAQLYRTKRGVNKTSRLAAPFARLPWSFVSYNNTLMRPEDKPS
jgi:hypothetical protein